MMNEYLKRIDECIKNGHYKNNWKSLCKHPVPRWYRDAKFGVFIHWGVYSVPAFGNEWYPRQIYLTHTDEHKHHIEKYGKLSEFGYKDFIPSFKAENFSAKKWMDLFEELGAKFIIPVAEHHDGFQMYDSDLSEWNSVKMGPKKDVLAELKIEAEKRGITFCASSHRAEHFWFFGGGRLIDSDVNNPEFESLYGPAYGEGADIHDIYDNPPTEEFLQDWLVRTCEIVDKYRPKIMYFDWWIDNLAFKPYLQKFAAYYYNRAIEWGEEVTINYKYSSFPKGCGVYDIERGQLEQINPDYWQNDTAIAKNSWGYTENNDFKKPLDIISDLIDIVSKNGSLLLNVGPKADGTITDEETYVLKQIGKWLKINGEGIYETTNWDLFGEGPTKVEKGYFTDTHRAEFTDKDIRYTCKGNEIFAFILKCPKDGKASFEALKLQKEDDFHVEKVEVLGSEEIVEYNRNNSSMDVNFSFRAEDDYPVCVKITIA